MPDRCELRSGERRRGGHFSWRGQDQSCRSVLRSGKTRRRRNRGLGLRQYQEGKRWRWRQRCLTRATALQESLSGRQLTAMLANGTVAVLGGMVAAAGLH